MIRLITFATEDFTTSAASLKDSALRNGVDYFGLYREHNISGHFEILLEQLLPNSRGYGWWMWKPYIILNEILNSKEGNYLIYCDAGTTITGNVKQVIDAMDEDIFLCSNGWQHSHWCKQEVSLAINRSCFDGDEYDTWVKQEYFKFKQVQASFIIFKVNDNTRKFVQEWLSWCIMPGFIDNTPRGPQFPGFQEHRHDQSILCCLQIKYGYKLHWFPSSTGHHIPRGNDPYPEILLHHRKRNNEW